MKCIVICSKGNPIRILNGKKSNDILKTYIIRNQVEEIINPICLKINQTVRINYISDFFSDEQA